MCACKTPPWFSYKHPTRTTMKKKNVCFRRLFGGLVPPVFHTKRGSQGGFPPPWCPYINLMYDCPPPYRVGLPQGDSIAICETTKQLCNLNRTTHWQSIDYQLTATQAYPETMIFKVMASCRRLVVGELQQVLWWGGPWGDGLGNQRRMWVSSRCAIIDLYVLLRFACWRTDFQIWTSWIWPVQKKHLVAKLSISREIEVGWMHWSLDYGLFGLKGDYINVHCPRAFTISNGEHLVFDYPGLLN